MNTILPCILAAGLALAPGCAPVGATHAQPAASPQPNIVILLFDGLRHDRTSMGGNERPTTPTLAWLAERGVVFERAFSQSNESLTSHASLFTGRYPTELAHPDYQKYLIPDDALTVAETLKAVGYDTAGFAAGGHVKAMYGFDQGFDVYQEGADFGSFHSTVPLATDWLDSRESDAPFFLFLHGYDLHRPYAKASLFDHPFGVEPMPSIDNEIDKRNFSERVLHGVYYVAMRHERILHASGERILDPNSYVTMEQRAEHYVAQRQGPVFQLSDAQIDHVVAHYDASALCADTYAGLFLDHLIDMGLWDDTLIIATADHGEDLHDHGYFNHRAVIFDSSTHVPMVLSGGALPEAWRGQVRPELTDAVDLVHTLMDAADSVPPAGAKGRSLMALLAGETVPDKQRVFQQGVLGQTSVRTPSHRLVFSGLLLTDPSYYETLASAPLDGGNFSLFHSAADPQERSDILHEQEALAGQLRDDMVAWSRTLDVGTETMEVSDEVRKMMQERGYW